MSKINLRLFLLVFSCHTLAWCSPAFACETVATAKLDSTCVVMQREGRAGVWFALAEADGLRRASLELPELRLQVGALTERSAIRDYQVTTYKEVIALKDSALSTAEARLETFARAAREAEEGQKEAEDELGAWYRSPALWAVVGAALVTGVVVALEIR